jgi:hypothetical protein
MKINSSNGWTEAVVKETNSKEDFFIIATIIDDNYDIHYSDKIDSITSNFFDFKLKSKDYRLQFNPFLGLSIFPKSLTKATNLENKMVIELANTIDTELNSKKNKSAKSKA